MQKKKKPKNTQPSFHPPSYTSLSLKKQPRQTISTSPPKTFPPHLAKLSYPEAKAKIPLLSPFGDADNDHVINKFDCRPFDYYKHKVPEGDEDYPVHSVKRGKEKMSDVFFRLETRLPQVYKEGGSTEKEYSDLTAKYLKQRRQRQQLLPKDTPYKLSTTPKLKGKKTIAPKSHFDIVGIYPNIELKFTTQEALMVYKYIIEYLQKENPSKRYIADPTNAKMYGKLKVYDYNPEKEYKQLKDNYIGQKFKQAMKENKGKMTPELKRQITTLSEEEEAYLQDQISYDPYSVEPEIKDVKTLLKKAPQHIKSLQTLLNQKPIVTIMISDDPADVILQASQLKKSAEKTATFSDIKKEGGYAGKVLTAPSCQRIGGMYEMGSFSGADWHNAVAYIYTGNKKPDKDKWDGRLSIRWGLTKDNQVEVALEDCVYPWSKAGEEHGSAEANLIYSQAIKHALHKILGEKGYTREDVNIKIPKDKGYSDVAQTRRVEQTEMKKKDEISGGRLMKVEFPTKFYGKPDLSKLTIDEVDPAKYTKVKKGSIPKPLSQFLLSLPETHKETTRTFRKEDTTEHKTFIPAAEIMKKGSLDEGTLFANLQRYAPSIAKRETLPEEKTVFNYFATGKVPDTTARKSFLKTQELRKEHLGPFFEKSKESDKLTEIGTLMQREYAQKQPYQLFALGEVPESAYHIAQSKTISAPVLAKIAFAPVGQMTDAKKRLLHRDDLAPRFIRALIKDPELHIYILEKKDTELTNNDFENMFKNATDEIKRFLIRNYPEHLKTSTIVSYITSLPHHKQKDELINDNFLFKSEYISFDITLACAKIGLSDDASNSDWINFVNYTLSRAKRFYRTEGHTSAYKIIEQLIRTLPRHVIQGSPLSEILKVSSETTSADQLDDIITKLMKKVDKIRLQQKLQDNYYPIKERAKQSTIEKIEKYLKTTYTPKKELDASKFEIGQPVRIKANYDFTPDEKAGFVGPGITSELKSNLGYSAKITYIKPFGEITLSSPFTEHEFPVKPQWIKPLPKDEGRNFKPGDKVYLKTDNLLPKEKEDAEDIIKRMNLREGRDASIMFDQLKNIRTPATVVSSTARNDAPYDNVLLKHHGFSQNYLVPSNVLVHAKQTPQPSTEPEKGDTVEILDYDDDDYPDKDEFIGKTGKLIRFRQRNLEGPKKGWYYMVWIKFRDGTKRLFIHIKLRKVHSFSVGQQVKIRKPTEQRRQGSQLFFGTCWQPPMDDTVGQVGRISEIVGGMKSVSFRDDESGWSYRPADLEPVNLTRTTQQHYSRDDPLIQGYSTLSMSDIHVGDKVVPRNITAESTFQSQAWSTSMNDYIGKIGRVYEKERSYVKVEFDDGQKWTYRPKHLSLHESSSTDHQSTPLTAQIDEAISSSNLIQAIEILYEADTNIDDEIFIDAMKKVNNNFHQGHTQKALIRDVIENRDYVIAGNKIPTPYINFIIEHLINNNSAEYYTSASYSHRRYDDDAIKQIFLKIARHYYDTDQEKLLQMVRNTSLPADVRQEIAQQFTDQGDQTNILQQDQTLEEELRNTDVGTSTFSHLIHHYIEDHSTEDTLNIIDDMAQIQERKVHPGVYDLARGLVEAGDDQALSLFTDERYWSEIARTYGEDEAEDILRECASWYYQQNDRKELLGIIEDRDFPQELRDDLRSQYFDFLNS